MGEGMLARLAALLDEDLAANNFEAERVDLGDDADRAQWILKDPDTGYHFTIEVAPV